MSAKYERKLWEKLRAQNFAALEVRKQAKSVILKLKIRKTLNSDLFDLHVIVFAL